MSADPIHYPQPGASDDVCIVAWPGDRPFPDADLTFDLCPIPFEPDDVLLKALSGHDRRVQSEVWGMEEARFNLHAACGSVGAALACDGITPLRVVFVCETGRHLSVVLARAVAELLDELRPDLQVKLDTPFA